MRFDWSITSLNQQFLRRRFAETLLPVDLSKQTFIQSVRGPSFAVDMIYEPEPRGILIRCWLSILVFLVYRCMCESVAAEHGARITQWKTQQITQKTFCLDLHLHIIKQDKKKLQRNLLKS